MAARDDHDVGGFVDGEFGEDVLILFGMHFGRFREALGVGVGFTVVDDGDAEAGKVEHLRETFRDVAAAEDENGRLGIDAFHEHLQLSSTDQTVVVRGILAEAEVHVAGLAGLDDFAGGVPDFGFDAAAADGAD